MDVGGWGVPPILVLEQQCAEKVQSRACEFSFGHLVGGEPEACSISHVTNSANFAPML
jgi:hypothetical protein